MLRLASTPDQRMRATNELWRKHLTAVGLRIRFEIANWPDSDEEFEILVQP